MAHTWPEATADDTTTGSGLIAALDADSARVTVDDTIAFYDTATARSATGRGAPKQNGTCVSTETTVERAGSHDQEDDADRRRWTVNINGAPGIEGFEVYHPQLRGHVELLRCYYNFIRPHRLDKGAAGRHGGGFGNAARPASENTCTRSS